MPKIAIIGGTGIYNPDTFELIDKVYPDTPYGKPSDEILIGKIAGVEVAFLHRHGTKIPYPPSSVPYRCRLGLSRLGFCNHSSSRFVITGSLATDAGLSIRSFI